MNREDRLELFLIYDRDPDDDDANAVEVCGTREEALSQPYPASYPITRAVRGELGPNRIYAYDDGERIR